MNLHLCLIWDTDSVCNSPSVYLSLWCLGRFECSFFTTEKIFTQYQEAAEDLCFSLQERRTASVRLLFTLRLKIHHFRWWCQSSVARSHEGRFSRSSAEVKLHLSKHLQAETWKERKTQPCFLLLAFPQRKKKGEIMRNCQWLRGKELPHVWLSCSEIWETLGWSAGQEAPRFRVNNESRFSVARGEVCLALGSIRAEAAARASVSQRHYPADREPSQNVLSQSYEQTFFKY